MKVRATLEKHFKDVQDVEFTIQEGKLFMLQTRNGKRTAAAALKFSMDMVKEKLIDWKTAILRNPADQLDQLLAPIFDLAEVKKAKALANGLPAGPGAASGKIYLNADRAAAAEAKGEKVLLVRNETCPEDLRGMIAAEGILTAKGGVSSHAALVARQMGKVCICGASAVEIDYDKLTVTAAGQTFKEGDYLSIDGTSGIVYGGQLKTAPSEIITGIVDGDKAAQKTEKFKSFLQLMEWCSQGHPARRPHQRRHPGADPHRHGLRRHRHRPHPHRAHVLRGRPHRRHARDDPRHHRRGPQDGARQAAALSARGLHRHLQGAQGLPGHHPPARPAAPRVPAAHQGAATRPRQEDSASRWKPSSSASPTLHEFNPMLGHRGCRLGIAYPEITEMQARAIFEAAADVAKKKIKVKPEVMIPLVGFKKELDLQAEIVHRVAKEVMAEKKVKFDYHGRHHDRSPARRAHRRRDRARPPSSSASAPTTSPRPRSASAATTWAPS